MGIIKRLRSNPEWLIIALIFLFRVVFFWTLEYAMTPDSWDYLARDGFAWLRGSVDRYRLPVYPMLIDVCKWLSEDHYQLLVCTIQLLISLFSVVVLYWTIKKLVERRWICLLMTFLYGTLNAVSGWDKTLLTESLSLSLSVFIIYGIVSYIQDKKYRYVWITSGCLLVGCFLRAVFAIYAGLFLGFLLLITIFPDRGAETAPTIKQRMGSLKSALIALLPVVIVLAYAGIFYVQYGAFTLSDSALGQQLSIVLENGNYEDSSDEEIKEIAGTILTSTPHSKVTKNLNDFLAEFYENSDVRDVDMQKLKDQMLSMVDNMLDPSIEEALDGYIFEEYQNDFDSSFTTPFYLARLYIMENYDRDRVVKFVDESNRCNVTSKILQFVYRSCESFSALCTYRSSLLPDIIKVTSDSGVFFLDISLLQSLFVAFIELIVFFSLLLHKKKADWIRLGLGTYIGATVLLSLLGTNAEFARTAQTSLPFMFVAIGLYVDWIRKVILCSKTEAIVTK